MMPGSQWLNQMFPIDVEYIRLAWCVDMSRLTTCLAVLNIFCSCMSVRVSDDTSRSVLLVEVCWILNSDVYGADIDAHTVVSASYIHKIKKLGG